jgi:hypothetical protein
MKKILLLIGLLTSVILTNAGQWVPMGSENPANASIVLVSSSIESSTVQITLEGFFQKEVITPRGPAMIIRVEESSPILEKGSPDLARLTASLIIPDRALMQLEVVSASYREFSNVNVAPSKGNFTRDIDPATVPYTYGSVYSSDQFFPGKLADLADPYIIRDHRGQTLIIYPFQYNPVTRILRVYTDMTITIRQVSNEGVNPLVRRNELSTIDRDFNKLYEHHFLNARQGQIRYTPVEEEGNMLIICYGDFMDEMQPFIEWKTLIGRPVEMVDVADIGNSSAIKSYVANYYNAYGLTYLLLVGDAAQVPTSYASGDSDNDYTYIVGADHYPDIFAGRFSAENSDQVITQVTRTVNYEKNPISSPEWYTRNMGIGSSQGPGDDNEMDYQHIRNMQTDLMNYTYDYNAELFDGSQGGNDAGGNPNPSMVASEINTGTSIILYCGHGSVNSWSTSGFSSSDINSQLTNAGMLPFIWSVACVNGDFKNNTCFAETWLRATYEGQPKGAIATLMSTINQSWDPPMEGQDEMVDILVESYQNNIKRTFGALSMNGCMKMNDSYGSGGVQMTDTWTVFGDPSVVVRTASPSSMTANYPNPIPMGSTQLVVNTNASEGIVCLSFNGAIVSTAFITSGGSATLTFPPINSLTPRQLTIYSYNHLPHLGILNISGQPAPAASPFPTNGFPSALPFTNLMWSPGQGGIPDYYKVYFGTNNPPTNIVNGTTVYDTVFDLSQELEFETQYYWQIKSFNQYGNVTGDVWSFIVGSAPDEDFESGSFFGTDWFTAGNAPWVFDNDIVRHGTYSVRSGSIAEGMSSSLLINHQSESFFMVPISFYYKVSSLEGQNFLQFLVDGIVMGEWSGEIDWTEAVINIAPGLHTFEWKYTKSATAGPEMDHAWIDYVEFPPETLPVIVHAGEDGTTCESSPFALSGSASNYTSLFWTTSGDGQFDDPTLLDAHYTPGIQDTEEGQVLLTLTAYRDDVNNSDDLTLIVQHGPYVDAGNPVEVCSGSSYVCADAVESFCASLRWTTSGDGSFDDPTLLNPVYMPGPEDIAQGTVHLTLTGTGVEPCGEISHTFALSIIPLPEIPPMPDGPTWVDLYYTPTSTYTTSGSNGSLYYNWSIEPGAAGNMDSDGAQCVIIWNPQFIGNATINVKGLNDCGESLLSEGLEVLIGNTVGFKEETSSHSIRIMPNPNHGLFTLEFTLPATDMVSIRIMDAVGSMIIQENDIPVSGTYRQTYRISKAGIYFLSVEGTSIHSAMKIMIN